MEGKDKMVKGLSKDEELEKVLKDAATTKLVVLEFMKPDNQVCIYVKGEVDRIATEMKDKADFYELDVNNFRKYAERFQVEALPAFVLMQNFRKKRHVVGTDELEKAIYQVHDKIATRNQDESGKEGNPGTQAKSGQDENTGPKPTGSNMQDSSGKLFLCSIQ
ncbi:hypothetical protein EJB05_27841 [Eragrostis curvula]|uniref:Thioredoxin domain-containing protein n=1 Tax=Eragrostis curvula TaxID=38414 RepID=A0A5J9UND3_9POAL|nr:hypothetical protein EJB05_27841 [Eragrostis curvula]